MGLFDFFQGTKSPAFDLQRHIGRLVEAAGWKVNRLEGDMLLIDFYDTGIRPLTLYVYPCQYAMVSFGVTSEAEFPKNHVPPALTYYLLLRGGQAPFGGWVGFIHNDATARFVFRHRALIDGLTGAAVRQIGSAVIAEAEAFDKELASLGLL